MNVVNWTIGTTAWLLGYGEEEDQGPDIFERVVLAGPSLRLDEWQQKKISVSFLVITYPGSRDPSLSVGERRIRPYCFEEFRGCRLLKYAHQEWCGEYPVEKTYSLLEKQFSFLVPSNHEPLRWGCLLVERLQDTDWDQRKGDLSFYAIDPLGEGNSNAQKPVQLLAAPIGGMDFSHLFSLPSLSGWREAELFTEEMKEEVEAYLFYLFIRAWNDPQWRRLRAAHYVWHYWNDAAFLDQLAGGEETLQKEWELRDIKQHPVIQGIKEVGKHRAVSFADHAMYTAQLEYFSLGKVAVLHYDGQMPIPANLIGKPVKYLIVFTEAANIAPLVESLSHEKTLCFICLWREQLMVRIAGEEDVVQTDPRKVLTFDQDLDESLVIEGVEIKSLKARFKISGREVV